MCFSSVLLPHPEPPRITKTSPRFTSKLTFSRMVRPSTRMIASPRATTEPSSAAACVASAVTGRPCAPRAWTSLCAGNDLWRSYVEHEVDHGEDAVDDHDEHDPGHDGARGRVAHRG